MPTDAPTAPPSPLLAELAEGAFFEGYYAIRESSLHAAVNGKRYIRLTLGDSSGQLAGNVWDATQDLHLSIPAGSIVKAQGLVETYKGRRQAKVTAIRPTHASEINGLSFIPRSSADPRQLRDEMAAITLRVQDADYQRLLRAFLDDPEFIGHFSRAPAAKEVHHAYLGGLREHAVNVARMARHLCDSPAGAGLDASLLLTGALLHDIGKLREYRYDVTIDKTDIGRLLGHITLGVIMVEERSAALPGFPEAKRRLLQHLILSHHGTHEFGSPVLPATPEALALHHLDNLDAKTDIARRLINDDPDPRRRWTDRAWMLDTALFKGFDAP